MLSHPVFSHNLALSDYWLFPEQKEDRQDQQQFSSLGNSGTHVDFRMKNRFFHREPQKVSEVIGKMQTTHRWLY